MIGAKIPIENIYYLLCYAWDRLDEAELTDVSLASDLRLSNLFGRVLRSGVTHLLKRGLDRHYQTAEDEIAGIRGRFLAATTVKRLSHTRARAVCAFDDLSADVLHNRIVKATLRRLAGVLDLDQGIAEDLRDLYRRFPGVRDEVLSDQAFRRVTLGRNTRYYGFLLDVCELVHRNVLVDERTGTATFRDFTRDDKQMANLFERFLYHFFEKEQTDFDVGSPRMRWSAEGTAADLAYLPEMRTDVVLVRRAQAIVLDAKYYATALGEHFGKESIQAAHLYQMLSYLSHMGDSRGARYVTGVLVYPRTTHSIRVRLTLRGHPFLAATIDLSQPAERLHRELLDLLADAANLGGHEPLETSPQTLAGVA